VDIDISLDYGLTLLAALLVGTGFVLQQHAAQGEPDSRFLSLRLIADLLRAPRWLTGIACMVAGQILAAWSIGHLSLAFVEPLLTTNLVFALVLAVPLAKASLKLWEILGAAVLCLGVALLSASRSAKPIGLSFGSASHWWAAGVIAAIAFAAVQGGRRRRGRSRAMLTGIGAGLVFGIQDALTRQTLETLSSNGVAAMFTTWAPYALVGAGATGIWLMQSAFNAGPLQQSLPAISAGEPLVGMLLGVIVFGDRIQVTTGELALQAGGIVALVVGVVMVGRAPALSQLRAWTPANLPHVNLPSLPSLPNLPNLPTLPALPGLPGRHSEEDAGEHPEPGSDGQFHGQPDNGDGSGPDPGQSARPTRSGSDGTSGASGESGTSGTSGNSGVAGTPGPSTSSVQPKPDLRGQQATLAEGQSVSASRPGGASWLAPSRLGAWRPATAPVRARPPALPRPRRTWTR
jgi:drug/metabolite transporter (DMT)-like permease